MKSTQLPKHFESDNIEIIQDGGRVWINDHTGLIGRYNSHTGANIYLEGTCDWCEAGESSFDEFAQKMLSIHQIDLREFVVCEQNQ
jgi:hypothetical protein